MRWPTPGNGPYGTLWKDTASDVLFNQTHLAILHLEHVVVSDWMAVACEHHRAKRKLQFEKSQQFTLCEYDLGDSGVHSATKRSYRTIHILRRIEITLVREFMNNLAVFIYYLLLGVLLQIRSHFL